MKKIFLILLFIIVLVAAFSLHLKNQQSVSIDYYFGLNITLPVVLLMSLVFVCGLLIGTLLTGMSVIKNKRQVGKARRQLQKVEKEAAQLKSQQHELVTSPQDTQQNSPVLQSLA